MRLGVLDVGSNTVHLLVVDAHPGASPQPAHSRKTVLRLAEQIGPGGVISDASTEALVRVVAKARRAADRWQVAELLAFATSAIRDAVNGPESLRQVRDHTGVDLRVLSGEDEARATFLAVRRWFGWSAGQLLVLDIGGGSVEIASGLGEQPELAISLPLGAGRLTRDHLTDGDPPSAAAMSGLTSYVEATLAPAVERVREHNWHRSASTSHTFRSLARLAGAAPANAGRYQPRSLSAVGLRQVLGFVRHIPSDALASMAGVDPNRSGQLLAGAVVAEALLRMLEIKSVDHCPWALREGLILQRLDIA